jgi:hypothetical protein
MPAIKINPLLDFKTNPNMYIIDSKKKIGDLIMTFQTNKSGTFNPSFTLSSGILKWTINGVDYNTNSPSVVLTGTTVTVKVYAGTTVEGVTATDINFISQNIIGALNFSWFTLNGSFNVNTNPNLSGILFSNYNNSSNNFSVFSCPLVTSLNLSAVTLSSSISIYSLSGLTSLTFSSSNSSTSLRMDGLSNILALDLTSFSTIQTVYIASNTKMASLSFSASAKSSANMQVLSCVALTSLNFSSFTLSGILNVSGNTSLTSITFGSQNNTSSNLNTSGCTSLATLDLSSFTLSGSFNIYNSTALTSLIFKNVAHTCSVFVAYNCRFSTLDLSNHTITGACLLHSNPNLASVNFGTKANVITNLQIHSCALLSLSLANSTITNQLYVSNNTALSAVSQPIITIGISEYLAENCALPTSDVDEIFSFLNVFFNANTPVKNMQVRLNGGTNGSPTGGANNSDILALIARFSDAGYTFTYIIN